MGIWVPGSCGSFHCKAQCRKNHPMSLASLPPAGNSSVPRRNTECFHGKVHKCRISALLHLTLGHSQEAEVTLSSILLPTPLCSPEPPEGEKLKLKWRLCPVLMRSAPNGAEVHGRACPVSLAQISLSHPQLTLTQASSPISSRALATCH